MPVIPNAAERLLLRLGLGPEPMLDIFAAGALRAAATGIELGIFEALEKGSSTTAALAATTKSDPRALGALLELLRRTGYVRRTRDLWSNTTMTSKWLVGPRSIAMLVANWSGVVTDLLADLPDTIRRGHTRARLHEWLSARPERWRIFNNAMAEIALGGADEIAEKVKLSSAPKTLIDIGGNHAINTIAFCRRYSQLRATIFDLPEAFGDAPARIRDARMTDRISLAPGDFTKDALGERFDVALILNVLHYQRAPGNIALLKKTHDALAPGGTVVILEQLPEATPSPTFKTFVALFDLLCITALDGGVATYRDIAGWLGEAGFTGTRRIGLRKTPASALIVATRT